MTALGPVSAALEADLREQSRQLGIPVWLDRSAPTPVCRAAARSRRHPGVSDPGALPARQLPGDSYRGGQLLWIEGLQHALDAALERARLLAIEGSETSS